MLKASVVADWLARRKHGAQLAEEPRRLNRAERRARRGVSFSHFALRQETKAQRRAFGGWPSASRPGHASVR